MAEAEDSGASRAIFKDVYFTCIPSSTFREDEIRSVATDLQNNGAVQVSLNSSELRHITHLICKTSDFPAYQDAVDAFINVVTPTWVQQSIAKGRTSNPKPFSPDPKYFLSSTVITIADDIPEGDRNAIIGGIMAFGGQYAGALNKLCTHVIAMTERNQWCRIVIDKKLKSKMVLPHWFDHCMKLGKKLDETPYLLPDPPLLKDPSSSTTVSHKSNPDLAGSTKLILSPPTSPSKFRNNLGVWRNKRVMFSDDLEISPHSMNTIQKIVRDSGGVISSSILNADILICRYRDCDDFKRALANSVEVGNLSWFYWLTQNNLWTSPRRRLLHFPVPKDGLTEFKGKIITISNYSGEARQYLESLITATGAKFTRNMSQANTHLITAHTMSEKCDAAREWGIEIINHLWLEESYAKCQAQPLTETKYNTFPEQTNLGEILGQTPIDMDSIRAVYIDGDRGDKQMDTEQAVSDLDGIDPSSNETPASRRIAKPITPFALSPMDDKENETPTSRGAKARALNKLHGMAADIALYEKERKRVGGVTHGGRRVSDTDRINMQSSRGRKRSSSVYDADRGPAANESSPPKKSKKVRADVAGHPEVESSKPQVLRVLCTAMGDSISNTIMNKFRDLPGIRVIDFVPKNAAYGVDVVVTPRRSRTCKFLSAIAHGPSIVRSSWIEQVVKSKGENTCTEHHELEDYLTKTNQLQSLSDSLARARIHKNKGGLFKNWSIFISTGIEELPEAEYQEIIVRHGGKAVYWAGRDTWAPKRKTRLGAALEGFSHRLKPDGKGIKAFRNISADDPRQRLFLVSHERANKLWSVFKEMATRGGYVPAIVDAEWLIESVLAQHLCTWQDDWDLDPAGDRAGTGSDGSGRSGETSGVQTEEEADTSEQGKGSNSDDDDDNDDDDDQGNST